MTTKQNDVWDRIRSVDPMNSIDVTGAVNEPAARDLMRRITSGELSAMTAPAEPANVLAVLDADLERPERRRGRVVAVAAAVVVVGAVVTSVWHQHRSTSTLAPDRQTTAAGYSKALLSELPLPARARTASTAPIPELEQSPFTGNGILDARVAWWTVPSTFTSAVASFSRAALPAHWRISARAFGGAGPSSRGWVIEVRDPGARFVSSVTVVIAAHGNAVGLLAQVDTYAIPVRTPAQIIASSTVATFDITGPGRAEYGGISSSRAALLARQINATPTFVMLTTSSCPAPARSMTVTFSSGSRRWSLRINDASDLCDTPSLTGTSSTSSTSSTSGAAIDLTPSRALVTDVLTAAGLPADYLDH